MIHHITHTLRINNDMIYKSNTNKKNSTIFYILIVIIVKKVFPFIPLTKYNQSQFYNIMNGYETNYSLT